MAIENVSRGSVQVLYECISLREPGGLAPPRLHRRR